MTAPTRLMGFCLSALCVFLCGCTACRSRWRKSFLPRSVVTARFYEEAPKRIVVLPFAPKPRKGGRSDLTERSAVACRNTFYRHFSVSPFEDVELHEVDRVIHIEEPPPTAEEATAVRLAKSVDVIGIRSLLNLHDLLKESPWEAPNHREDLQKLRDVFGADAYAIGTTRDFGWWYALIVSMVRVGCKMEIRSCKTGALLWRGRWKQWSFKHAFDTALWIIPYRLMEVWYHTRGEVLENVTDQVFRDLVETIPFRQQPCKVFVEPTKPVTRTYKKNGAAFWNRNGLVRQGERFPLLGKHPGWYHCQHPKLDECWIFEDHAKLVDEHGEPVKWRGRRWFGDEEE